MSVMKNFVAVLASLACAASAASAQTVAAWDNFDFAHKRVDSAEIAKLSLPALRSLRGIVFGRHGRPLFDRGGECVLQGFLGELEIAHEADQRRQDTTRLVTKNPFDLAFVHTMLAPPGR